MAFTLTDVNLFLDIVLKLVLLALLGLTAVVLKHLDRLVRSVERSAESLEETSEKVGKLLTVSRYIPFMGGRDERLSSDD